MSFGLNARATNKRMVDKMFKQQISQNIKVCIDDMLVKLEEDINHIRDYKKPSIP